jgi:hypothetical protein
MLGFIKSLFGSKPAEPVVEVPYKVEQSATTTVQVEVPTPTPVVEQATAAIVESIVPAKPAAKKTPAAKKAPASKKPRRPRAPKVTK